MTKPKRLSNKFTHPTHDFIIGCCDKVRHSRSVYQKNGNEETFDITEADIDPYGNPVFLRKDKTFVYKDEKHTPLCLDPADPTARLRALEARAMMDNVVLPPTIYEDSITAVQRSNNIADKVLTNINTLNSQNNAEQTT